MAIAAAPRVWDQGAGIEARAHRTLRKQDETLAKKEGSQPESRMPAGKNYSDQPGTPTGLRRQAARREGPMGERAR